MAVFCLQNLIYLLVIFADQVLLDPTFCGIFVCGPLQSFVVYVLKRKTAKMSQEQLSSHLATGIMPPKQVGCHCVGRSNCIHDILPFSLCLQFTSSAV